MHPVAERRRVGQAGGHHVARARPRRPPTRTVSVGAVQAELVQRLEDVDELVAQPVLEGDPPASTQRGISSTSSCSTLTHSTGPMPSGKSNTSGSLNGAVVNQPRSFSQITGGFRHSSIVVQMENDGAKS